MDSSDQVEVESEIALQAQRQQQLKAMQAAALGKVTQLITKKVQEHLVDELQYYCLGQEPILFDK